MHDPILAREAKRLVSTYQALDTNKLKTLDPLGNRIIQRLIALGHLKSDACHIEWEGVDEFGLVPIFYEGGVLNLCPSGEVEFF